MVEDSTYTITHNLRFSQLTKVEFAKFSELMGELSLLVLRNT